MCSQELPARAIPTTGCRAPRPVAAATRALSSWTASFFRVVVELQPATHRVDPPFLRRSSFLGLTGRGGALFRLRTIQAATSDRAREVHPNHREGARRESGENGLAPAGSPTPPRSGADVARTLARTPRRERPRNPPGTTRRRRQERARMRTRGAAQTAVARQLDENASPVAGAMRAATSRQPVRDRARSMPTCPPPAPAPGRTAGPPRSPARRCGSTSRSARARPRARAARRTRP